jgi:site-specific recombinase XerD
MNEKNIRFFKLVRDFLTVYLPDQKTASPNTVKSYRESLNLLLHYICNRNRIGLGNLSFEHLSRKTVESFLDYTMNGHKFPLSLFYSALSTPFMI